MATEPSRRELTPSKGVLLRRPGMVRYLYPPTLPYGVVIQIYIGRLVEAMVRGFVGGRAEVVVDVREAAPCQNKPIVTHQETYRVKSDTSPCCGGILSERIPESSVDQSSGDATRARAEGEEEKLDYIDRRYKPGISKNASPALLCTCTAYFPRRHSHVDTSICVP